MCTCKRLGFITSYWNTGEMLKSWCKINITKIINVTDSFYSGTMVLLWKRKAIGLDLVSFQWLVLIVWEVLADGQMRVIPVELGMMPNTDWFGDQIKVTKSSITIQIRHKWKDITIEVIIEMEYKHYWWHSSRTRSWWVVSLSTLISKYWIVQTSNRSTRLFNSYSWLQIVLNMSV